MPQIPGNGSNPQLTISGPPTLGTPVTVTLTFDAVVPDQAKDVELYYRAYIELRRGIYEIVSGEVEQTGRLTAGEHPKLEVTAKSIRIGDASIACFVEFYTEPISIWGGVETDALYIFVWSDHAEVSDTYFDPYHGEGYPSWDVDHPERDPIIIPYDEAPQIPSDAVIPDASERTASFI